MTNATTENIATTQEPSQQQPQSREMLRMREAFDAIEHQKTTCVQLRAKWEALKERTKDAKKQFDAAMSELIDVINDLNSPQMKLPFPVDATAVGSASESSGTDGTESTDGTDAEQHPAWDEDAWKHEKLIEHFDHRVAALLAKNDIETMGDLSEFTDAGGRLIDLKGVGAAKVEKIEDAIESFWQWWATKKKEYEAAAAGEDSNAPWTDEMEDDPEFDDEDDVDEEGEGHEFLEDALDEALEGDESIDDESDTDEDDEDEFTDD